MTELEHSESVYDLVQRDPFLSSEVLTARIMNRTTRLFNEALQRSKLTQAELADLMEVSAGRVSQLLGEPANLRISTIVRLLSAAGFETHLGATSKADGTIIDGSQKRRTRDRRRNQEQLTVFTEEIPSTDPTVEPVKRIIFQNSATSRNTEPSSWNHVGKYQSGSTIKPIRAWTDGGSK